jgi:hypothetical protein
MKKLLVINGHGSKLATNININQNHGIITPGDATEDYVVSFDNQYRHLEESTYKGKIWPIYSNHQKVAWQHYQNTTIPNIAITPLQPSFNFDFFANSLLTQKCPWGQLTNPSHDPLARGALALRTTTGIKILEGTDLSYYLKNHTNLSDYQPIFYCDKELGKVKPMAETTLAEIYSGIDKISEFKVSGTATIVATCSPTSTNYKQITVKTSEIKEKVESVVKDYPVITVANKEQQIRKALELAATNDKIKVTPRVKNYLANNLSHNARQPLESIQFEFNTNVQKDIFKKSFIDDVGPHGISYDGHAASNGLPILQLHPDAIDAINPVLFQKYITLNTANDMIDKLPGISISERVSNYIKDNDTHNKSQPLESLQFEFKSEQLAINFVKCLIEKEGATAIIYQGQARTTGAPIVQVAPKAIANIDSRDFSSSFVKSSRNLFLFFSQPNPQPDSKDSSLSNKNSNS